MAGDGERMAQLSLASSELTKQLSDGPSLDATAKDLVQLFGSSGNADQVVASLVDFHRCGEANVDHLAAYKSTAGYEQRSLKK